MLTFYNVIIGMCVLCMVTMIIHVNNNIVFSSRRKMWFSIAFALVAVCASAECIGTYLSNNQMRPMLHYFLTSIEFSLAPFIPVCMSYACGIEKPAKIIGTIDVAHVAFQLIMIFFGGVFYITADGTYHRGNFYFVYIIIYLISYLYNLVLIALISRDYKSRDIGSVIAAIVTILFGLIPSIIDGTIRTAYLCVTLLMLLEYLYFDSLFEQDLQKKISNHNEFLSKELIHTLSYTLEAKDMYTNGHSIRVAEYTKIIAERLGFDKENLDRIHFEASLHDIGKIGIPDTVLNKPGKLTEREFGIIKMHPAIGADILINIDTLKHASVIARSHHERYDGGGYPDGLSGENIPYEARIVAVADTYDAMSSRRVYRRRPLSDEAIREIFIENKGKQFDPKLVDVFIELFDEGKLEPIKSNNSQQQVEISNDEGVDVLLARDQLLAAVRDKGNAINEVIITIDDLIDAIESAAINIGAFSAEYSEFKKLYNYLENLCKRYDHQCFLVMVSVESDDKDASAEDTDIAIEAFDIATKQSIRNVDVCARFDDNKYLIILLDSGEENVRFIMERIINYYFKIQGRTKLEPKYEYKQLFFNAESNSTSNPEE